MEQKYARHGDVHLVWSEIKGGKSVRTVIPNDAAATKETILEEGELTGHAHRLRGGQFVISRTKNGVKFLHVGEEVEVTHEEHHTRPILPGDCEIRRTRETDHMVGITRQVAD